MIYPRSQFSKHSHYFLSGYGNCINRAIFGTSGRDRFDIYTLSRQKYLYTARYPCTDCAIYRLKNQLGTKMGIEICKGQKFIVLALTLVKIFDFLTFHEVLIY